MNNVRKLEYRQEVVQETGTITKIDQSTLYVQTDRGNYAAQKAVSCLVEPQVEDVVLVACSCDGGVYVLAILERPTSSPTRVAVTGDLSVQVTHGRFLVAANGLDFLSPSDISLNSSELQVHTQKANVFVEQMTYLGQRLHGEIERIKTVAGTVDSLIQRISQKIKRSYKTVEEIDQVRSEQIDYRATKNLNLHGKNALITANDLIKMDGEQIHLG